MSHNFSADSNGPHSNKFQLWSQRCWPLRRSSHTPPCVCLCVLVCCPYLPRGPSPTSLYLSQVRKHCYHLSFMGIENSIFYPHKWQKTKFLNLCLAVDYVVRQHSPHGSRQQIRHYLSSQQTKEKAYKDLVAFKSNPRGVELWVIATTNI